MYGHCFSMFSLLPHTPPRRRRPQYSFHSSERPVCQQCSGSIPKVNKLTHGTEWIVSGLPPSRGQSEWSVLFGQLSWGEMSGLHRPARRDGLMDGRTEEPNEVADKQIGRRGGTWHCWGGKQCSLVTLKLLFDWNNDLQFSLCPLLRRWHREEVYL